MRTPALPQVLWVRWWAWGLMLALWACGAALAQPTVLDAGGLGGNGVNVTEALAELEDPQGGLTLDDVLRADAAGRFQAVQGAQDAYTRGFTTSVHWLRFELTNTTSLPRATVLEVANARVSGLSLYLPDGAGSYRALLAGERVPFSAWPMAHHYPSFPVLLAAGERQRVYLRVHSNIALIVPVRWWSAEAFRAHAHREYMVHAWYFGVASAMVLFNLMLCIGLRDRIYGLYVAYVVCALLTLGTKAGLTAEFLGAAHTWWTNLSYYVCASLAVAAFLAFSRVMLATADLAPRMDRWMRGLQGAHLLLPLGLMADLRAVAPAAVVLFLVSSLTVLGAGLRGTFRRQRIAYFYLGAFAMLLMGSVMTLLRTLGWLPTNELTVDGLQFGSALEMLLLAFALADRFNQMRREKLTTQQELVVTQQALLTNLQQSERTLALKVEERTHELQVLNAKLEALSTVDGLTGIANRRHFDSTLQREWQRMLRLGEPLALIMVDVDWFKRYNDEYGHQAGDECLRAVARALTGAVNRTSDLVARYGGEEFVMIAPATSGEQALALANKACAGVAGLALPHRGSQLGVVSVSCGVAALVPVPHAGPEHLLRLADMALYQAKQQGRHNALLAAEEQALSVAAQTPAAGL